MDIKEYAFITEGERQMCKVRKIVRQLIVKSFEPFGGILRLLGWGWSSGKKETGRGKGGKKA